MLRIARGDKGEKVSALKDKLIFIGFNLSNSGANAGVFGYKTEAAVTEFQGRNGLGVTGVVDQATWDKLQIEAEIIVQNPAYLMAKKYAGKGEKDKVFVGFLSGFWKKLGLNFKTIIGSSFAWCGLFLFAMNTQVGQKAISGAAGAKNWAKYGVELEYKVNGAPKGAVVHINHKGDCKSAKNNHVAFLDGNCTAEDLTKKGGVVPLFGGNQSDMVKRSIFSNSEICEIRWPEELPLPGKITESVDCGGKSGKEGTR